MATAFHLGDRSVVGRSAELDVADEAISAAGRLLIAGEAGIGKSTMVAALAPRLSAQGYVVHGAVATAGLADHPLAAFGHLIGDPGSLAGPALVRWAADRLAGLASGTSGVVIVDDAHLLDDWSLHVLTQLGGSATPRVVVTARTSEPWPAAIAGFGRHPGIRIDLQRLSSSETAAVAANVLGSPLDTPSAARIHAATDGLPLAVDELLRYALRHGSLVLRSGLYRWDADAPPDQHLAQLLGLRVDELSTSDRNVVDLLALAETLPIEVLDALVDDADLDRLEAHHLVRTTARPGWLTSGHPLLRDAAIAQLSGVRRHQLTCHLVRVLHELDDADPQLERRRVQLSVQVGAPIEPDAVVAMARWARAHGLWAQMIEVFERAWRDAPSGFTGLAYGEALYWTRRMEAADEVFRSAGPLCVDDDERVQLAIARARTLEIGLGRDGDARALRGDQLDRVTDEALRLDVLAAQCERSLFAGDVTSILAILDSVPPPPWSDRMSSARYRLTQSTIGALTLSGSLEAASSERALHLELSARHADEHPLALSVVEPWWVSGNILGGRVDVVGELLDTRYREAIGVDDGLSRPLWALPMSIERWLAGDLVAAELYAREAMGVPDSVVSIRRMATHFLARVLELRGQSTEALVLAEQTAGDDYVGIVHGWSAGLVYACRRGLDEPDQPGSLDELLDAARSLVSAGQLVSAAFVLHDGIRARPDDRIVAALHAVVARVDAVTVHWMHRHATALLASDVDGLVAVAAEAVSGGCLCLGVPIVEDAARLAVAAGDREAVAETIRVRQSCHATMTGWAAENVRNDVLEAFGLTDRERDVARLAARGLTDREIADRLFISVRTVNAHLRSTYRKSGVGGRRELRALLVER